MSGEHPYTPMRWTAMYGSDSALPRFVDHDSVQ